ncbi:hypothetical protein [Oligoflexus tunisiensis]|uniref:hypothetical protein n=1 Tax=Oligoflexus tunisiensis TaxID=708132 RepID=UPI00114D1F00|nr:hypothetical protein [Oligoflexus tunisiensis]
MHVFLLAAALLSTPNENTENAAILKAIDNICGDTWCEGDYSFRFDKVTLDTERNSTQVFFNMSYPYSTELDVQASILTQSFDVSCVVPGYSTYAGIMENEYQLNWDFYTSLTDCIQTLEERLTKINRI